MTLLNMYEIIKRQFPELGEKDIVRRVSWKEREFAGRTRCLFSTYSVTPDNTSFSEVITIPYTNCQAVRSVRFYDSSGLELDGYTADLSWYIVDRDVRFTCYDGTQLTTWPTNVATITLTYTYLPAELTLTTDELQVEERFHRGILNGALEDLYAERGDIQKAMYFNASFKDAVREGKRYANSDGNDANAAFVQSAFSERG